MALFWLVKGKFAAPFGEIKPHGNWIGVQACSIFSFKDGKISSERSLWDGDGLLKQLKGEVKFTGFF